MAGTSEGEAFLIKKNQNELTRKLSRDLWIERCKRYYASSTGGWKWGEELTLYIPHKTLPERVRPCAFCRSVSEVRNLTWITIPTDVGSLYPVTGFIHKPHYACFTCCRGWKAPIRIGVEYYPCDPDLENTYVIHIPRSKCTHCGNFGKYMGLNFRAPKPTDKKGWRNTEVLYNRDSSVFEARCKCP